MHRATMEAMGIVAELLQANTMEALTVETEKVLVEDLEQGKIFLPTHSNHGEYLLESVVKDSELI